MGGAMRLGLLAGLMAIGLAGCGTDAATTPAPAVAAAPSAPDIPGLDDSDRQLAAAAEQKALQINKSGQPVSWSNPANPARSGSVAAGPAFFQNGLNCRPVTQTVYIDGVPQVMRATACQQPGGPWKRAG